VNTDQGGKNKERDGKIEVEISETSEYNVGEGLT